MRILQIEDSLDDAELIARRLQKDIPEVSIHRIETAKDLRSALSEDWDLVICDYSLPQLNALSVLDILKDLRPDLPCIIVSGSIGEERAVELMRAGASDYLMKDNLTRLAASAQHMAEEARQRRLLDATKKELRDTAAVVDRLKRFFPPQIADQFVSGKIADPFEWRNQEVTVVFIDLRGFTTFAEKTEPRNVLATLNDYYRTVAHIAHSHSGSVGHLAADGIMIFFNDPVPIEHHERQAVQMALKAREALLELSDRWGAGEIAMNFGIGLASGQAAIGGIGVEGCWDFAVVGTVTNLASRLCSHARAGQILVSRRFLASVEGQVRAEEIGKVELKGLPMPVQVFNIDGEA